MQYRAMTVKEYSKQTGISVQSIYRRLKSPSNAAALDGHISRSAGAMVLDDYAVKWLEEHKEQAYSTVIADQQTAALTDALAEAGALRKRLEELQSKYVTLAEKHAALAGDLIAAKEEALQIKGSVQRLTDGKAAAEERERIAEAEKEAAERLRSEAETALAASKKETEEANERAHEAERLRSETERELANARTEAEEAARKIEEMRNRGLIDRILNRQ